VHRFNRRRFLASAAAGGLAYAFGGNSNAAAADYKALICVFLFGGNDSFNMVVPRTDAEYAVYATARRNLAIAQSTLLPIGALHGLHPSMNDVATLFTQDEVCAVIANVGPLIEPTTKDQYEAKATRLPPQLFSHNDQQDQWHALKGEATLKSGWGGRIADVLTAATAPTPLNQSLAMNLSLFGQTLFQAGVASVPYTMGETGPVSFFGLDGMDPYTLARRAAFENILRASHATVYERAYSDVQQRALLGAARINSALATVRTPNTAPFTTAFPATSLGQQLKTVAELIAVRDRLEVSRQIFFVATGGFDTHDAQTADQPGLLGNLSRCLAAFYRATVEMSVASSVTAFTQSDFGRTLTSNGDGTDHGWGGNQLVIGGSVAGGTLYGSYPLLQIGGPDDVGAGRMIPGLSSDQYAATLARWFGVPATQLATIAPHIGNFTQADLGFML
jgi:uncharacterized protein (DUF1501 family)